MPITPATISVSSGITGSYSEGAFIGFPLAPSASTKIISNIPDFGMYVSSFGVKPFIFFPSAIIFLPATVMVPLSGDKFLRIKSAFPINRL